MKTLYTRMVEAAIPVANHQSDLYVPVTPQSTAILKQYEQEAFRKVWYCTFLNQVEGGQWYDIAFMYTPWWEQRA